MSTHCIRGSITVLERQEKFDEAEDVSKEKLAIVKRTGGPLKRRKR
jgi:hypothetical protein